jgi:hypothetical protein
MILLKYFSVAKVLQRLSLSLANFAAMRDNNKNDENENKNGEESLMKGQYIPVW